MVQEFKKRLEKDLILSKDIEGLEQNLEKLTKYIVKVMDDEKNDNIQKKIKRNLKILRERIVDGFNVKIENLRETNQTQSKNPYKIVRTQFSHLLASVQMGKMEELSNLLMKETKNDEHSNKVYQKFLEYNKNLLIYGDEECKKLFDKSIGKKESQTYLAYALTNGYYQVFRPYKSCPNDGRPATNG